MISSRSSARLHDPGIAMGVRRTRGRRRGGRALSVSRAVRGMDPVERAEWSLERILKNNSAALTFLGITLGVFISRRFFALPFAVGLMMAQDSLGNAGLARAKKVVQG
jgi:hypothetical protein